MVNPRNKTPDSRHTTPMGCTSSNTGTKEPKADAPAAEGAEGAAPAENAAPADAAPAEVAPVEE